MIPSRKKIISKKYNRIFECLNIFEHVVLKETFYFRK